MILRNKLCWLLLLLLPSCALAQSVAVTVNRRNDVFIIDATVDAPASLAIVWNVLTDFEHMPAFLSNLASSKVSVGPGNTLLVKQTGEARYGPFAYPFASERSIQLEPMQRIVARNLSGTAKRMESESLLLPAAHGVQIRYRAELVLDSFAARMFGAPFVQHETEEQFRLLLAEMKRRESLGGQHSPAGQRGPALGGLHQVP